MQWLELVRVCENWDAQVEERLQDDLPQELEKLRANPRCRMAAAFQHVEFPGDFAVVVIWSGRCNRQRSRELGLLAEYLTSFGMVDHLLWVGFAGWFGSLEAVAKDVPTPGHADVETGQGKATRPTQPKGLCPQETTNGRTGKRYRDVGA
ncbi:MAG: hypothetical protein HN742_03755 [Lentisphaerae bacterium]|jgi:hypothetical protein|nr:hypothetical protein [Lentisphaerota bacterium]MBT4814753.1 hypothetical protein [Lentisphaerota bacterium]MBT5605781.1 hypothetical protein [Lentisphaerota bacterium]MBT7055848.1 hypothetical protein [Lentisphaerota bacterium]MBT7840957.1 hypothetical protein [Lentisphaerota bacterium]